MSAEEPTYEQIMGEVRRLEAAHFDSGPCGSTRCSHLPVRPLRLRAAQVAGDTRCAFCRGCHPADLDHCICGHWGAIYADRMSRKGGEGSIDVRALMSRTLLGGVPGNRIAAIRARLAAVPIEPVPVRITLDRDGTCDGCSEAKHLVASYPDANTEPWLCAECAAEVDLTGHARADLAWLLSRLVEAREYRVYMRQAPGPESDLIEIEDEHGRSINAKWETTPEGNVCLVLPVKDGYLVARAEAAEAERDRLAGWKREVMPILDGLQDLGMALRLPFGERITGTAAHDAVVALRAERDEALAKVARVEALAKVATPPGPPEENL